MRIAFLAIWISVTLAGASTGRGQDADTLLTDRLSIRINIPAFRLDVWEDSTIVRTYPIAVGLRRYRTPIGAFAISRVVWNPWWHPPESDWAKDDTVTPPGPKNPMGKVKLMIHEQYFLHGTSMPASIGRAASHGCIRMHSADAVDLARLVLAASGLELEPSVLDSLVREWRITRTYQVRSIPVQIVYELAEWYEASLLLHGDVYRRSSAVARESEAISVVHRAGYDTLDVDRERLRTLLEQTRKSRVRVPIDSVLRSNAAPLARRGHAGIRLAPRAVLTRGPNSQRTTESPTRETPTFRPADSPDACKVA